MLAVCALPQVIKCWRTRKADDLSWLFLLLWFGGEVLTLAYILIDDNQSSMRHWPLYLNYGLNIVMISYLFYAKVAYKQPATAIPSNHKP